MIIQWKWQIQGIGSDGQRAWRTADRGPWHCIGSGEQTHPQNQEKEKGIMVLWDSKGKFLTKMGTIKDRNCMRQKIWRRGGKNTQNYTKKKKNLNDPYNHDNVITHLEPDILECEDKCALGSITMNKASGGDGIPVGLFQILKDDAVKVLYSICQQIWKTHHGHRTGKGQFSFQSQRKAMPKNA